jgi:hypothetical protein
VRLSGRCRPRQRGLGLQGLFDVVNVGAHPLEVVLALGEGFGEVDHGDACRGCAILEFLGLETLGLVVVGEHLHGVA